MEPTTPHHPQHLTTPNTSPPPTPHQTIFKALILTQLDEILIQENIHTKMNHLLLFQMWGWNFGQQCQWIVIGRLQQPMRSQEREVEIDRDGSAGKVKVSMQTEQGVIF